MSQATMKVQPKTKDQQTGAHAVLTARRIVAYAVLILLCALCLFFFYVLIINATRPHADIQRASRSCRVRGRRCATTSRR